MEALCLTVGIASVVAFTAGVLKILNMDFAGVFFVVIAAPVVHETVKELRDAINISGILLGRP